MFTSKPTACNTYGKGRWKFYKPRKSSSGGHTNRRTANELVLFLSLSNYNVLSSPDRCVGIYLQVHVALQPQKTSIDRKRWSSAQRHEVHRAVEAKLHSYTQHHVTVWVLLSGVISFTLRESDLQWSASTVHCHMDTTEAGDCKRENSLAKHVANEKDRLVV
jgi:hypothetical protein